MIKKKAAALKYLKENLNTPVFAALGEGSIADKILYLAKQNGIKIIQNKEFFKYENNFFVNKEIPSDVYGIVSDIIADIIKTNIEVNNVKKNFNK